MTAPRPPVIDPAALEELSTTQLVSRAVAEVKQLARAELDLAKQDLRSELHSLKRTGVVLVLALVFALLGLMSLVVSIAFAVGGAKLALGFGMGCLVVAGVLVGLGYRGLPKHPFATTRKRLADDIDQLKEHIA